ncbi:MAG: hypothetical protein LBJ93_01490 [Clostridiales bacterium]|nr:hypothetical protein [Clostridiales bacterium]
MEQLSAVDIAQKIQIFCDSIEEKARQEGKSCAQATREKISSLEPIILNRVIYPWTNADEEYWSKYFNSAKNLSSNPEEILRIISYFTNHPERIAGIADVINIGVIRTIGESTTEELR